MIEECNGCMYQRSEKKANEILAVSLCRVYDYPELQHTREGGCAMRPKVNVAEKKEFVDPLKASKQAMKVLSKSKKS
jgi:hypothetical protein